MIVLLQFISALLTLYIYVLIAMAVMSWLIAFRIVSMNHQVVRMVVEVLYRITEPVLRPIRKELPDIGGIDISPVIVILIIILIQLFILPTIEKVFS